MKTKQNRLRLIPAPCFQALMHVAFQRNASKIDAFLQFILKIKKFQNITHYYNKVRIYRALSLVERACSIKEIKKRAEYIVELYEHAGTF